MDSSIHIARFLHCIADEGSLGIFTQTTPPKLVSWVLRNVFEGHLHHLYTLEEYRGRGLANAVVREMCKKIQEKGDVHIEVGNKLCLGE